MNCGNVNEVNYKKRDKITISIFIRKSYTLIM
jgi:hypothetical protein